MRNSTIVGVIVVLLGVLGGWYYWSLNGGPAMPGIGGGPQACTEEAMVCPDGSYVGRTGPNCAFAPCPTPASGNAGINGSPNQGNMGGSAAEDPGVGDASGSGAGFAEYHSGIRGTVMAGPTCPVMQNPPQPGCEDKPLATEVSVSRAGSSQVIATTESDAQGAFTFTLSPGSYVVTAGKATMPRCNPVSATVGPDSYVKVAVDCDTGIR